MQYLDIQKLVSDSKLIAKHIYKSIIAHFQILPDIDVQYITHTHESIIYDHIITVVQDKWSISASISQSCSV